MKPGKQQYLSYDISIRFRFLSILSFIFLLISALSLILSITFSEYIHSAVNLFVIVSSFMAYRTARSLKPQMSFYYFVIGFLVFSIENSIFWSNEFFQTTFSMGLYILTMLMVINMFISFTAAYKAYQIYLSIFFSIVALLFYNIFQLSINNPSNTETLLINLKPLLFFIIIGFLLTYMFFIRRNVHNHYKDRYRKEKKHLKKFLAHIDVGYASFKIKYNSKKQPLDAKIEHFNESFLEMLNLSHTAIDEAKLSELNHSGNVIFEDYMEILHEFDRNKKVTRNININNQSYHCSIFSIDHRHMGMIIKKA